MLSNVARDHDKPSEDPNRASSSSPPSLDWTADRAHPPLRAARRKNTRSIQACDHCRRSKVRCDGLLPCKRCIGLCQTCEYLRVPRRRGRVPGGGRRTTERTEIIAPVEHASPSSDSPSQARPTPPLQSIVHSNNGTMAPAPRPNVMNHSSDMSEFSRIRQDQMESSHGDQTTNPEHITPYLMMEASPKTAGDNLTGRWDSVNPNELQTTHDTSQPSFDNGSFDFSRVSISPWTDLINTAVPLFQFTEDLSNLNPSFEGFNTYLDGGSTHGKDANFTSDGAQEKDVQTSSPFTQFPHGHIRRSVSATSPGKDGPSPSISLISVPGSEFHRQEANLRYPVLRPLMEHLIPIVNIVDACNLLDHYFTEPTDSNFLVQPHSPYVLAHVFRKATFLHPNTPRATSPALLCAILFVAVQTTNLADLKTTPFSKAVISKRLLDLCHHFLGPLAPHKDTAVMGEDDFTGHLSSLSGNSLSNDLPARGQVKEDLDTVITYIHLGTIVSAGDYKGQGPKYWRAATLLAVRIGLNVELGQYPGKNAQLLSGENIPISRYKEMEEERRRTWWLLYICDRHIALAFNSPLLLPQTMSDNLYLPLDDKIWQGDDFAFAINAPRQYGPLFKMTSVSPFGFFLPLMRILGDIVNLHHMRNELNPENVANEVTINSILASLQTYEESVRDISGCLDELGVESHSNRLTRIVLCYSNHLVHVLYILAYGSWDPMAMLDDADLWIASPRFITLAQHAVAAAETISQILVLDPELNYMPYLWGIYLLQGSFPLLLFAERVAPGREASEKVVAACETVARAHEVCVTTLNTEYQRNFRRVLRWALQILCGKDVSSRPRQSANMRESLLLYRWTKGGSGLAL